MKPEKQQLIHDLLDDENRRETTLLAGASILSRRRHWRAARQYLALMALASVMVWLVGRPNPRPAPPQISTSETKTTAPAPMQSLTDDELLALFPHTPVGLVTLSNGKKMLIFLRPRDEKRLVTRI